jgi:hypothetical protein
MKEGSMLHQFRKKCSLYLSAVLFASLFFSACASGDKKDACPPLSEEAVSVCRAKERCRQQRGSVGVGLGVGFGIGMGGFGVGASHDPSRGRYERCLDEDLKEQQAKAKAVETQKSAGEAKSASPKPAP